MASSFYRVAADHVAARTTRSESCLFEVRSKELRLSGSSQSRFVLEGRRLERHWVNIYRGSDTYACLPWLESVGLELGGNCSEDCWAPPLRRGSASNRTTLDQACWCENQRLGAAISEADIEAVFKSCPYGGAVA